MYQLIKFQEKEEVIKKKVAVPKQEALDEIAANIIKGNFSIDSITIESSFPENEEKISLIVGNGHRVTIENSRFL